jgi:hypothetical protein
MLALEFARKGRVNVSFLYFYLDSPQLYLLLSFYGLQRYCATFTLNTLPLKSTGTESVGQT